MSHLADPGGETEGRGQELLQTFCPQWQDKSWVESGRGERLGRGCSGISVAGFQVRQGYGSAERQPLKHQSLQPGELPRQPGPPRKGVLKESGNVEDQGERIQQAPHLIT